MAILNFAIKAIIDPFLMGHNRAKGTGRGGLRQHAISELIVAIEGPGFESHSELQSITRHVQIQIFDN